MAPLPTIARDNAVHCEVRKIGYRQSKDGVVVSFVLHPSEVPDALATSGLGTRYMLALVEIGDDEKPVAAPEKQPRAKQNWNEMSPAQQAGILSSDKRFQKFIIERGYAPDDLGPEVGGEDIARAGIYDFCWVKSRADIENHPGALSRWRALVSDYRAWERAPGAGA